MRIKGWKQVFGFTFLQQIKTKSFIISTVVITLIGALIAASANLLPLLFLDDVLSGTVSEENTEKTSVNELYIYDSTGMSFDFGTELEVTPQYIDEAKAKEMLTALETDSANKLLATISFEEGAFSVSGVYSGGETATIEKSDCEMLCGAIATGVRVNYLRSLGVADESIPTAMTGVSYGASVAGKDQTSPIADALASIVPMISSLVLFIFIFSYSQMVAQSVATEKTSRVMEYLLTSVKPLAIIVGKILAMCCVSLLQFLIIGVGTTAGVFISMPFGILSKAGELTAMAATSSEAASAGSVVTEISSVLSTFNAGSIVFMFIVFILGFLFYSTIAGLAGASISKMEDLSAAIQPMSLIGVLGFYLAYFPAIGAVSGETNIMMILSRYIPISSPFVLPSAVLLNQMSVLEGIFAVIILLIIDIVMMMIVAKVYEHIILHTGNRLKFSEMLNMAKANK